MHLPRRAGPNLVDRTATGLKQGFFDLSNHGRCQTFAGHPFSNGDACLVLTNHVNIVVFLPGFHPHRNAFEFWA